MSVPRYWRETPYRYRLVGSRCKDCGKMYYPPRMVCRRCGSRELEEVELAKRGKLVTFTVIRSPPRGYEEYVPYVVGIIELEGGVRVLSQVVDCPIEEAKTGMELEATFRKVTEDGESGIIMYGTKFRPVIE
ncbi:MAG: Zn-ribbon domain-containing OB-fold protein [Candidatus Bathyarchaeia archaeon]